MRWYMVGSSAYDFNHSDQQHELWLHNYLTSQNVHLIVHISTALCNTQTFNVWYLIELLLIKPLKCIIKKDISSNHSSHSKIKYSFLPHLPLAVSKGIFFFLPPNHIASLIYIPIPFMYKTGVRITHRQRRPSTTLT